MLAGCPGLVTLNLLNLAQLMGPLDLVHDNLKKVSISSCERVSYLALSLPALKQVELMALPELKSVAFLRPSPDLLCFAFGFCKRVDPDLLQQELTHKAKSTYVQLMHSSASPSSFFTPSAPASDGLGPLAALTSSWAALTSSSFFQPSSPPTHEDKEEQKCLLS